MKFIFILFYFLKFIIHFETVVNIWLWKGSTGRPGVPGLKAEKGEKGSVGKRGRAVRYQHFMSW